MGNSLTTREVASYGAQTDANDFFTDTEGASTDVSDTISEVCTCIFMAHLRQGNSYICRLHLLSWVLHIRLSCGTGLHLAAAGKLMLQP